jgi:WD40 repeat protein
LILYDVRNRRAFPPLRSHTARLWSVAFAPDGKTVASTSNDGTIKLWNVATRQVALNLRGHIGPVSSAFFSSDGRWMATSGVDATVRLWPAVSLDEITQKENERK